MLAEGGGASSALAVERRKGLVICFKRALPEVGDEEGSLETSAAEAVVFFDDEDLAGFFKKEQPR